MSTQTITLHPLFDPKSEYNRLRSSGSVANRMRGYVHGLASYADRQRLPLPTACMFPEELRRLRAAQLAGVPDTQVPACTVLDIMRAGETHVIDFSGSLVLRQPPVADLCLAAWCAKPMAYALWE